MSSLIEAMAKKQPRWYCTQNNSLVLAWRAKVQTNSQFFNHNHKSLTLLATRDPDFQKKGQKSTISMIKSDGRPGVSTSSCWWWWLTQLNALVTKHEK